MVEPGRDGFVDVSNPSEMHAQRNLQPYRNEFSPFSGVDRMKPETASASPAVVADSYYGQTYNAWQGEGRAIYGRTDDLPEYAGDHLANEGFLRVPFRRIPRCLVADRRELLGIVSSIGSANPARAILFRGQNREHLLNRSPATLRELYGDEATLEPSLLPAALRPGTDVNVDQVLVEWSAVVQVFLGLEGSGDSREADLNMDLLTRLTAGELFASHDLGMYATALAQHYGLPTFGLDVTGRLDMALFFALNTIKLKADGVSKCDRMVKPSERPVIYIIAPLSDQQLDYDRFRPPGIRVARPDAQDAHFLHAGWGLNRNGCAREIFVALYLDPDGDFGPLPTVEKVYPADDRFATYLDRLRQKALPDEIARFLRHFTLIS
jgi:hypothetical protein